MTSEHQLRKDICEVGRRMYDKNFVAASDGNISILMEDGRVVEAEAHPPEPPRMPEDG